MPDPRPSKYAVSLPLLMVVVAVLLIAILSELFLVSEAYGRRIGIDSDSMTLSDREQELLQLLGEGVIGERSTLSPIHDVTHWFPLVDQSGEYIYGSGKRKGSMRTDTLNWVQRNPHAPPGSQEGGWSLSTGKMKVEYLVQKDGNLLLPTELDLSEGVVSVFDPPEPVLLESVKPGEPQLSETTVSVYDLHAPSDLKYTGTLQITYIDKGAYEVTVPSGTFEARLITITYVGKVGPAHVSATSIAFYAKGVGRVAYIRRNHVSAFLVYNKTTQWGFLLHEYSPLPDRPGDAGSQENPETPKTKP